MATQKEMDFAYSLIDRVFRLAMGDHGDISCAMYNGDYSLSLEDAQRRKHDFIFENLKLKPGDRVLDMGCGWGPMLNYLRSKGVKATGVTLSNGQAKACQKNGLDVHVMDCRTITPETFGKFDAVVSLGAFEHFCSYEEYAEGKQDVIYDRLFKNVYDLIPNGGRFFLQTMVFGPNAIDHDKFNLNADLYSTNFLMAQMEIRFPGSWLPYGEKHILRTIDPYFKLVNSSSGRLDYIETIKQWDKRYNRPSLKNLLFRLSLAPRYLFSKRFRLAFAAGINTDLLIFEREIFDHYRMVFEKK